MPARISLNKLGEYLQANPGRRKRIVGDAKNPQRFIVTRYADAKDAIKLYFTSGYDVDVLNESIENHEGKETTSEFQEQDQMLSIELLEIMLDLDLPDLIDFEVAAYDGANPKLNISEVEVSVNPDLIIRGNRKGQDVVGAIKVHVSKSNQLGEEGAKNIATVLKKFVEDHVAKDNERVAFDLCVSVDTFGKSFETAPRSFKRRMTYIEAACEEIALWWNKL